MTITLQGKKASTGVKAGAQWDEAIADAQNKIKKLHYSIRVFKARKAAGDSFPPMPELKSRRQSARQ